MSITGITAQPKRLLKSGSRDNQYNSRPGILSFDTGHVGSELWLGGESLHRAELDRMIASGQVRIIEIGSAPVPRNNALVQPQPIAGCFSAERRAYMKKYNAKRRDRSHGNP